MTTHSATLMTELPRRRRAIVPSAVLGALIFVAAELMFFTGILSALTISRAGAAPGTWPPAGQPSLASGAADATIAIVLASGGLLVVTSRLVRRRAPAARHALLGTCLLGTAFVVLQLVHLVRLVASGVTMTSSQQAGFFFLLCGLHTAHALATSGALFLAWRRLGRGSLSPGFFAAVQVFWYFVVLTWPVIHARVLA